MAVKAWRNRIIGHGDEAPDQLLENPKNWRIHPKAQQDALAGVLNDVGWVQPVLVNKQTGFVVDGHLRVAMAIAHGDTAIPVTYVDLTEAEEAEVLATFDPLGALAVADKEQLDGLLREVQSGDAAVQQMLAELAEKSGLHYGDETPAPDAQIDKAAELQEKWQTATGQLWQVGEHRILCGDSTKAEDVQRVMGGEKAALCLTDPPYANDTDYGGQTDTGANLDALIAGFLPLARECAAVVLITPGNWNQRRYPDPEWTLCWFAAAGKGSGPWGFSCWQPVLAYGKDPYLKHGKGRRPDALSQIEISPDVDHPCPKPIGVWEWFLERGSVNTGDIVYDPFLGSGTTLVACERLHRKGCGIEISPAYVAVCLERLSMMGLTPVLIT